jgi:nitrous oxidase accessory protein NosD
MSFRPPVRLAPALVLLFASGIAAAQHCGQVVTGTVRLTADLSCPGPGPALTLSGSAARLELGGFRIDMGGSGANAIDIHHAQNAQVTGPGVISSAGIGVSVFRSQGVEVWDIDIEASDAGVFANDSARVVVSNVRFGKIRDQAVFIGSTPGGGHDTSGAVVMGNQISDVGSGIHLCGQGTFDARVRNNTIRRANGWGVLIYDGAGDTKVYRNDIQVSAYQSAIEVRSGSDNAIHDNVLSGSRRGSGIAIATLTGQTCDVNKTRSANFNIVSRNTIKGFLHGTRVGFGTGSMAHLNNVQGNLYDSNAVDIQLERDSYATDARGNDVGTRGTGGAAVRDAGTLSLY